MGETRLSHANSPLACSQESVPRSDFVAFASNLPCGPVGAVGSYEQGKVYGSIPSSFNSRVSKELGMPAALIRACRPLFRPNLGSIDRRRVAAGIPITPR